MTKLSRSLLASMVFLLIFFTVYFIHVKFFKVDVILYSSIFDAMLATLLAGLILFAGYFSILSKLEKSLLIIIWLQLGYIFSITLPTVIDRSLSFYILEKIQQRGGGIKHSNFDYIFKHEYMKEHHLVNIRLTEQIQSGTIIIINDCVKLTDFGSNLAHFSRYFRKNLLPEKRLIMGQYTDALTDPFRNEQDIIDYTCQ